MGRKKNHLTLRPYSEDSVKRLIKIFGDQCAAAKAMREFEIRKDAGEDVRFWLSDDAIVVGPE